MCPRRFLTLFLAIAGSCLSYCCLPATAVQTSAAEGAAASDLDGKYKDKLVKLWAPYCGQKLEFDATGTLVSGGEPGDPMKCQAMRIQHAALHDGKLIVTAERVVLPLRTVAGAQCVYVNNPPDCDMVPNRDVSQGVSEVDKKAQGDRKTIEGAQVVIEMEFPPHPNGATAMGLMEKLFPAELAGASGSSSSNPHLGAGLALPGAIFRVGNGVLPPVPIFQPSPSYSAEARDAAYEGTVVLTVIVGPDGKVYRPRVSRSLGMGLDEKAVEKVLTWRFKPATRDGKPVAVEVSIEVQFRLYAEERH
jgi:TonB family protein